MRVVLDSNIFLSALLSPHGPPHYIYQAWQDGRLELITATVQIDELCRASRYPKAHGILQPHLVGCMLSNLHATTIIDRLQRGRSRRRLSASSGGRRRGQLSGDRRQEIGVA